MKCPLSFRLLACLSFPLSLLLAEPREEFRKVPFGALPEEPAEATEKGVDAGRNARKFELKLRRDERASKFNVTVENETRDDLAILGVQASLGLYVVKFPAKIPGNGKAKITLIWAGAEGAASDTEFVRILTPVGEKTITVEPRLDKVISYDTQNLVWPVGGAPAAKTVTVTCVAPTKLVSAQAAGSANQVTITDQGGGIYKVSVLPGSVAAPTLFPVLLEFSPKPVGVSTVIRCAVGQ